MTTDHQLLTAGGSLDLPWSFGDEDAMTCKFARLEVAMFVVDCLPSMKEK